MKHENIAFNTNLNILKNQLNALGISCLNHEQNDIEIFFNDDQKELILNMLSQIDSSKNGFTFKILKDNDQVIKSVLVKFFRNMDLSCEFLNNYLNNAYYSSNLNVFNKIDVILDSFPFDEVVFSIDKNTNIRDKFLVSFSSIVTEEQLNGEENFVLENEELKDRIVHTICSKRDDNCYNVTYDLLYQNENDLDNLLTLNNKKTNTSSKKLVKQLI